MSVVDAHPKRKDIIDAILSGKSLRTLAKEIHPPIAHSTLGLFRQKLLQHAAKPLRPRGLESNPLKDYIDLAVSSGKDVGASERLSNGLRTEISDSVRKKLDRQNKWIEAAEGSPIRDANGNVIMVEDKPLVEMDHRALAAHDRNQTSDLDLLARLGQLYSDAGESGPGLTAVMSFGDIVVNIGAVAAAPQVIDAVAEPMDVGIVRAGNRR